MNIEATKESILARIALLEEIAGLQEKLNRLNYEEREKIVFNQVFEGTFLIEAPTGLYSVRVEEHELSEVVCIKPITEAFEDSAIA